ncbi:kinase-like domain-containing protein [Aspergillus karnatakaensis]|uniref:kinase-like domain-containing protein n=1 Tax=Aspergillus karnatakaensis TaxID=1810916 RepID=UPI003CCCC778
MSPAYVPPPDGRVCQHEGTERLAINNTKLNRFLTLLALKTTAKLYTRNGPCKRISRHMIVKSDSWTHLTEAATMKFVSENTSIPVPKVYCSFVWKNRAYIVMQRIQGRSIPSAWRDLSQESRQELFNSLKAIIQELRSLKPSEGTGVESCIGGSLRDSRIPKSQPRFGPFETINGFHLWLRNGLRPLERSTWGDEQEWEEIKAMAAKQDGPWPTSVFTHGDLNPSNIFVHGDRVAGIIDWEFSGWYPHYWEYTSAWLGNQTTTEWQEDLCKFLDQYPAELEMEKIRYRWWGGF